MRLEAIALPLVRLALTEDIGGGDATTDGVVDVETIGSAHIESRQAGILAGTEIAVMAFRELDTDAKVEWHIAEGGALTRGSLVATISGHVRAILSAERVALNFLQHLSGIATLAQAFVRAVEGTGVAILDTRKTTPGLRFLEKHAVRVGGAVNHRYGLFDGILIKENHIRAAGGLKAALARVREAKQELPIVVEVKSAEAAIEAAALMPDRILLDNFTPGAIAALLKRLGGKGPEIELSGGMRLANIRKFALPGVHYISVGLITHSAPSLDLSLLLDEVAVGR